jgi:hypothetical protein
MLHSTLFKILKIRGILKKVEWICTLMMSFQTPEETKSCGLFSLTITSGLSFSFLDRYHPKIGVFLKITATVKYGACGCMSEARSGLDLRRGARPPSRRAYKRKICWREPGMSDDACFHLQTLCGSLAPAASFPRDFFSRGSHWVAHVRKCACVSLSWYRHTKLVFSGGLAPLAAQRVDGTCTEQQVGRPWGGRCLGLDHLLVKCALAHLAAIKISK